MCRPPFGNAEAFKELVTGSGFEHVATVTRGAHHHLHRPGAVVAGLPEPGTMGSVLAAHPARPAGPGPAGCVRGAGGSARPRRDALPLLDPRVHNQAEGGALMADSVLPVRIALEGLHLEFPQYRIHQRVIGDQLFYLAEAAVEGVQPRFAQAQTTDRLRDKLRVPETEFDPAAPSIARVSWVAKTTSPPTGPRPPRCWKSSRTPPTWRSRPAAFRPAPSLTSAKLGVGQFLDVGCGLPTAPNTHETAQAAQPDARVVYVDNDAQVLSHARNLLAASGDVLAVAGNLAYPAEIIYDWRVRAFLNFHQPVCLILAMTMHFFTPDQAKKITGQFIRALPDGSYVVMSVVGGQPQLGQDLALAYTTAPVCNHGPAGLAAFLDGLELTGPGIVPARQWPAASAGGNRRGQAWAAVGHKTSGHEKRNHDRAEQTNGVLDRLERRR